MRKIYEKSLILNISLLNKIKLERFIIDRRILDCKWSIIIDCKNTKKKNIKRIDINNEIT